MAANLPWDITMEILSRLPVKSLMRFKCVSKSFYSLISLDSNFKRKHLDQYAKYNSTRAIIHDKDTRPKRFVSCSLSSLLSNELVHQDMIELDNHVTGAECEVYNSCDGLLCIKDSAGNVCIWNPSTRELKRFPDCPSGSTHDRFGYGLGYDSSSGDYKVLSIPRSGNVVNELQLCSLKRDSSWRKIQGFPCIKFCSSDSYIFFNGAFYWLAETGGYLNRRLVIVSFEIKKEIYKEFEISPPISTSRRQTIYDFEVSVLGGKLYLYRHQSNESFDLWVIEEYGVMKSVKKILSIWVNRKLSITLVDKKRCFRLNYFRPFYVYFKPLYLFEDRTIMLHTIISGIERVDIYKDGDSVPKKTAANFRYTRQKKYICTEMEETLISPHTNS